MESFRLKGWRMENIDDDVRRLAKSWPKLRVLNLKNTVFTLSNLRIIAEFSPELRHLHVQLDTSTFSPFDANSKRFSHSLETLIIEGNRPSLQTSQEYQSQVSRQMDLIFPCLKSLEFWDDETWCYVRFDSQSD